MADFKNAIIKVLSNEGGYVNDPNDAGGETYCGISRKNWPRWEGWKIIDSARTAAGFPRYLRHLQELQDLVIEFYKHNFWDKIGGDKINNESIAEILVDSAVNEGISPAVKRAQAIVSLPETGHFSDDLAGKINSLA